jgi:hypothetical protein
MDLNLSLSYQEQNDNKAIILTDTTDNFNSSGTNITAGESTVSGIFYEIVAATTDMTTAGAPDSSVGTRFVCDAVIVLADTDDLLPVTPTYAEITAATLDTTITGVSGSAVVKTQVDLFSNFGPFTIEADLVYTITAALLGDTSGSALLDGLYALTYTISYEGDGVATKTDTLEVTILVYGVVKVATYQKLRQIPVAYSCQDGAVKPTISEADLCGAYLSGIENSAYVAKTEELLNMLVVLDNIILNGSYITW